MSTIHACRPAQGNGSHEIIQKMLQASNYWNPDGYSYWYHDSGGIGMAKAHLHITRRSSHDTVCHDSLAQLTITAHARIDNQEQLIAKLGWDNTDTAAMSESRLILKAYQKWGRECPAYLRGDFVFIIWDEKRQTFFCARDHFGIKVLFYSRTPRGIMVSNEHQSFTLADGCNSGNVSEAWLVRQLWGLGPETFDSPLTSVSVLPPAHTLEISNNRISLSPYWRLEPVQRWHHMDRDELIDEMKHRFEHAVSVRLDSLYPLGAELSEGLDSNGVAGYAARLLSPKTLYTFTHQCTALNSNNESVWRPIYEDIGGILNFHDNIQPVWAHGLKDNEEFRQQQRQELYQAFGTVLFSRGGLFIRTRCAEQQGVRVLLSGWGGDQCVSNNGDCYADELFFRGKILSLLRLLRTKYQRGRGSHPLRSVLSLIKTHGGRTLLRKNSLRGVMTAAVMRYAQNHFLSDRWRKKYDLESALIRFLQSYQRYSIRSKEHLELFELGMDYRIVDSELVGRLARLEYRYPMLDVDLVTFAHSLPANLKIYQGIERYPFRRVLEGVTSTSVQWRRKSDVIMPWNDLSDIFEQRARRISKSLQTCRLVDEFSTPERLQRYFEARHPVLLSRLDFLIDVDRLGVSTFD